MPSAAIVRARPKRHRAVAPSRHRDSLGLLPATPLPDAARHLLREQYRAIRRNQAGAARGRPAALHDLRVALRRAALLLGVFREPFKGASPGRLRRSLRRLDRKLGPGRDIDVWLDLLERLPWRKDPATEVPPAIAQGAPAARTDG